MRQVRKKGAKGGVEKATEGAGSQLPTVVRGGRMLTAAEVQGLAQVPPEAEWFANIDNPRTRRAYRGDIREFTTFVGIAEPLEGSVP
ncbi:MAG: hypothetical protein ACREI9_11405 [Nitrospiraceae bacterium]